MNQVNVVPFWKKVFFVLLLYFTIYSPPLAIFGVHFYFTWLLWPVSIYYIFFNISEFNRFRRFFSKEILLMVFIVSYSLIRAEFDGNMNLALNDMNGLMTLIIIPYFYIGYGKKIGIKSTEDLIKYILIATSIAVASTMLALLVPAVDNFIRNVFIKYREDELGNILKFRGFGLGSGMTSSYPFCIGMVIVLSFIYGKKEQWFKWIILFALIACLVNARTGALVAVVGIIVYYFVLKKYLGLIVVTVIGIIGYIYSYDILSLFLSKESVDWIGVFISQVEAMASGDTSESGLDYFTQDMAITPDSTMGWIFGYGISPFGGATINGKYYFSDMGFAIQLFYGGIIYCTLLYLLVARICIRLWGMRQKAFSVFLLAAFFIINFKGRFVFATPSFALSILLYYAVAIYGSNQNPYYPRNNVIR